MSISYSIHVKLNAQYSAKNILHILNVGKAKGLRYHKDIFDPLQITDLNEAVNKVLYSEQEDDAGNIVGLFEDIDFIIWFFKSDEGFLIISIGDFGNSWKNHTFNYAMGVNCIDFGRYIDLLLE